MQRCPCCNARLIETTTCPRCKTDLLEIIQVQQQAKCWYQKAIVCYLNNDLQSSIDAITQSLQLQHNASAFQFRAFVIDRQKQIPGLFKLLQIALKAKSCTLRLIKQLQIYFIRFGRRHSE